DPAVTGPHTLACGSGLELYLPALRYRDAAAARDSPKIGHRREPCASPVAISSPRILVRIALTRGGRSFRVVTEGRPAAPVACARWRLSLRPARARTTARPVFTDRREHCIPHVAGRCVTIVGSCGYPGCARHTGSAPWALADRVPKGRGGNPGPSAFLRAFSGQDNGPARLRGVGGAPGLVLFEGHLSGSERCRAIASRNVR